MPLTKVVSALKGLKLCAPGHLNKVIKLDKSSLTFLMKTFKKKDSWENICRKNVNQNITNNSPSNIL